MRRFLRRRLLISYGVIAVLAGTGILLWVRHDPVSVQYRTAAAALGTVTQTVTLSGNLAPVGERDLDFGGTGKVQSISAQIGQNVTAGQVLATEDPTSLQNALTQAQATLAAAQAKLSLDQQGATAQTLASAEGQVNTARVQLENDQSSMADTAAVNQLAVQQAQQTLQSATTTKNSDCSANPSGAQCAQDQQTVQQDSNALQNATVRAQQSNDQAQAQVRTAQAQLQNAQAALAAMQQGTSSQQIQMDQSQIQIDQTSVNAAQTALNAATVTAPADGVVAQVNITVGQQVSSSGSVAGTGASSTTSHAIVVLTPGAYEVTGSVSDALVSEIADGQRANVVPAGSQQAVSGSVTAVAEEATVTSGVASFPVTVVLDGSNPSLRAGMSAAVDVIVNRVVDVLTVPTTAVHTTSAGSTVDVLVKGVPHTNVVQVGAADALRTEILSGINLGDQVVIATVSGTVPTTGNGGSVFGGGRGGAGFGGGGLGGAGGRGGGGGG